MKHWAITVIVGATLGMATPSHAKFPFFWKKEKETGAPAVVKEPQLIGLWKDTAADSTLRLGQDGRFELSGSHPMERELEESGAKVRISFLVYMKVSGKWQLLDEVIHFQVDSVSDFQIKNFRMVSPELLKSLGKENFIALQKTTGEAFATNQDLANAVKLQVAESNLTATILEQKRNMIRYRGEDGKEVTLKRIGR